MKSHLADGKRTRDWLRRARIAFVVVVASSHLSCETIEKVLPYAIVAGGAIASVVALNYLSDCGNEWAVCDVDAFTGEEVRDLGYTEQVLLTIGTLTTVGGAAADYWAGHREKQRELARLQQVEQQIDTDYAQFQQGGAQPPVNAWGSAAGPPPQPARWGGAQTNPQPGWGHAAVQAGSPPPQGYPPQGNPPPQGYPPQNYPPQSYPSQNYPPQGNPPPPQGYGQSGEYAGAYPPQSGGNPWGTPPPGGTPLVQPRSAGALPMALETALLKRSGDRAVPVTDNDVLFDGIGESMKDEFRVLFRANQVAHVYVIGVDAVGRLQPLYPPAFPDRTNPLQAGESVLLPAADSWYQLDRYSGLQHIYFYASTGPDERLEKQLTIFSARPAPDPVGSNGQIYYVSVPTFLQQSRVQGRGIVVPAPQVGDTLRIPGNEGLNIPTTRVSAEVAGQPLVVTRVFQHQ